MSQTYIQQLADFTSRTTFESLPEVVISECKRALLDSLGCAIAAIDEPKGRAGIEYARIIGGADHKATIMGTGEKVSVLGAAFANGELISALDMDAILSPGHVSPYVIPAAVAMGESMGSSGRDMVVALAIAHEMSNRFGKAMDNQRQITDGKVTPPPVFGYASTLFGATAALGKLRGHSSETLAHALGIAGCISPVNSQIAWFEHAPSSTIKYLMAGMLAQQAITASYMGELGHRGDLQVLDDRQYGYARFIGTTKWEPERLTADLGTQWYFPAESSYKPYPHCRIMHAMMDCVIKVVRDNALQPHEIDAIKVYVEGIAERPVWLNRKIEHVQDAQFSMAHGISVAAHLVPPGKAWQDPKVVYDSSVMALMNRITTEVHPDYAKALTAHAASRPARIELRARGETFVEEKSYPKGSPSPDPQSFMTDEELAKKFRVNADGVLSLAQTDGIIDAVLNLEKVSNFASVMALAGNATAHR
jgi:2-methylcitrate dehydratase PrpD